MSWKRVLRSLIALMSGTFGLLYAVKLWPDVSMTPHIGLFVIWEFLVAMSLFTLLDEVKKMIYRAWYGLCIRRLIIVTSQ